MNQINEKSLLNRIESFLHKKTDVLSLADLEAAYQSADLNLVGAAASAWQARHTDIKPYPPHLEYSKRTYHYIRRCIVEAPEDSEEQEWVENCTLAAHWLQRWIKDAQANFLKNKNPEDLDFVEYVLSDVNRLYRESTDEIRTRLTHGFLEHLFEVPLFRQKFISFKEDPILREHYLEALKWGEAHCGNK